MNPIILGLSLVGSIMFFSVLFRLEVVLKTIVYYLFVFLLIAITNPLFSHNGETILFFLNGNPVTFEAIVYGSAIGIMLVSIVFWCKCYTEVLTTDKFIYLFGKITPKISLLISMALRFIPVFKMQIKKIYQAQKTLGLYTSDSLVDRIFSSIRVFNSIVTWSLENAVETADSMKARGYGLRGRSNFSIFKFQKRDLFILTLIIIIWFNAMIAYYYGVFDFYFYPAIQVLEFTVISVVNYVLIFMLMIMPVIVELKGCLTWRLLRSKI